jgi:hypothetical protein
MTSIRQRRSCSYALRAQRFSKLHHDSLPFVIQVRPLNTAVSSAVIHTFFVAATPEGSAISDQFTNFQRNLSNFLNNLPQLSGYDNQFQTASFKKCTLITTHTMAYAAVIRLNFSLANKSYSPIPVPSSYVAADQVVLDTLISYEQAISSFYPGPAIYNNNVQNPINSSVPVTGPLSGSAMAAVELCISSSRKIVWILNLMSQDDYRFLEPIIVVCVFIVENCVCPI